MALAKCMFQFHIVWMSKILKRVRAVLEALGAPINVVETQLALTAAAVGCEVDRIAKSIIFKRDVSNKEILFLSAGGNQVDPVKDAKVAVGPLGNADAAIVRFQIGLAIGGVSPVGHLNPIQDFW